MEGRKWNSMIKQNMKEKRKRWREKAGNEEKAEGMDGRKEIESYIKRENGRIEKRMFGKDIMKKWMKGGKLVLIPREKTKKREDRSRKRKEKWKEKIDIRKLKNERKIDTNVKIKR